MQHRKKSVRKVSRRNLNPGINWSDEHKKKSNPKKKHSRSTQKQKAKVREPINLSSPATEDSQAVNNFSTLGLSPEVLDALTKVGYLDPTPIQKEFIPIALTGDDCMGQARTGTGKTAAFLIPILDYIVQENLFNIPSPLALILSPTRELAEQVGNEAKRICGDLPVKLAVTVGGRSMREQQQKLHNGVEIVVGTPGRIQDLMKQRVLDLSGIDIAVLDEADRMLDIGFLPDMRRILKACPEDRQTLLLSATIPHK